MLVDRDAEFLLGIRAKRGDFRQLLETADSIRVTAKIGLFEITLWNYPVRDRENLTKPYILTLGKLSQKSYVFGMLVMRRLMRQFAF